tara:strand:- start:3617 stop:4039 length:423 start_codon:yes stop_codon:yes gene_type:complete
MKNPFKPKHIGVHMLRWHVIPRNRWFNVYLHKIYANDDERALHDHPWWSVSFKLFGGELREYLKNKDVDFAALGLYRIPPRICFRSATFAHRLEVPEKPVWTLFITGPYKRDWGFHCPKGWRHWSTMTTAEGKQIGGCDE